jgi:hypothetical protein
MLPAHSADRGPGGEAELAWTREGRWRVGRTLTEDWPAAATDEALALGDALLERGREAAAWNPGDVALETVNADPMPAKRCRAIVIPGRGLRAR